MGLIKKLRLAKKNAGPNEKPAMVKTHLRDMIIVPEMIGSVCGVYVSQLQWNGFIESLSLLTI
jgi:small subunit ribosomal protein S15e